MSSNCTSFAVHDEFLLLTTHTHTLRCISLLPTTRGRTQFSQQRLEIQGIFFYLFIADLNCFFVRGFNCLEHGASVSLVNQNA